MVNRVSIKRILDASPERIWQAWTVADELKQWFSSQTNELDILEFDVRPQGKVRFKSSENSGEYTWTYIKLNRPHEIIFDILDYSLPQYPEGIGGVCHVELKVVGEKTELTIWGELPNESLRQKYQNMMNGWNATLDKLTRFLKENQ